MRHPDHLAGILTLPTLLRLAATMGVGLGLLQGVVAVSVYWQRLSAGQALGALIASPLFNALSLMFATLVGYRPHRALAARRRLGLHRLGLYLLPANQDVRDSRLP